MVKGTQRTPVRETDRIALLERELADLRYQVANLLKPKPRTHPVTLELAKTFDDGAYPTDYSHRFPIIFQDAVWDTDELETAVTPRSAERMAYAFSEKKMMLPPGASLLVKPQRNGGWLIAVNGFRKFFGKVDQTEGIGAGGYGEVHIYQRNPSTLEWEPMLKEDESPASVFAHHPPPPDDVDFVPNGSWVQCEIEDATGLWILDVEYCLKDGGGEEDPVGNCCTDGVLTEGVTESECTGGGGTFLGEGTECEETDPLGFCCLPDGSCTTTTEAACGSAEGFWLGPDTACTEPCDPEAILGKCCIAGMCSTTTMAGCTMAGGVWMGFGECETEGEPCGEEL